MYVYTVAVDNLLIRGSRAKTINIKGKPGENIPVAYKFTLLSDIEIRSVEPRKYQVKFSIGDTSRLSEKELHHLDRQLLSVGTCHSSFDARELNSLSDDSVLIVDVYRNHRFKKLELVGKLTADNGTKPFFFRHAFCSCDLSDQSSRSVFQA